MTRHAGLSVRGSALLLAAFLAPACGGGGGGGGGVNPCGTLASALTFSESVPAISDEGEEESVGFAFMVIRLDSENVYWFDYDNTNPDPYGGGAIRRVSKSGGPVTIVAWGLQQVHDFVVDDSYVYWSERNFSSREGDGWIKKAPKGGGGPVTILAEGFPPAEGGGTSTLKGKLPLALCTASTYLYWGQVTDNGSVRRVPKAGGPVLDYAIGLEQYPVRMVMDASNIYAVDLNGGGRVLRVPLSGAAPDFIATGLGGNLVGEPALDGAHLYLPNVEFPGGIIRLNVLDGSTTVMASDLESFTKWVSLTADHVYFANTPNGVARVPKAGGTAVQVAYCGRAGGASEQGAVDLTHIYTSSRGRGPGDGAILKFPQ